MIRCAAAIAKRTVIDLRVGRRQAMLGRLAMQMRAIGVGDDQAGIVRENLARQILREGEEQPVAMHPVVLPFLVGAQILHR